MAAETTSTYSKAIIENMRYMGTDISEWAALEIKGFEEVAAGHGKTAMLPDYDFPRDYDHAKSLYQNENGGGDNLVCELCGHTIKNVYWIKNDSKKLLLIVGSECVTHFGTGESGAALAKKTKTETIRTALLEMKEALKAHEAKYVRKTTHTGFYGSTYTTATYMGNEENN